MRQFRILFRLFLFRVVDVELLSAQADPEKLLGQIVTVLLSVSLLFSVPVLFVGGALPDGIAHIFEHFFIASTMLVVGLFALLSWEEVFPNQRDVLVLSPLPVSSRTLFLAKMAALGTGLGVSIAALNGLSGLLWPWIFAPADSGTVGLLRAVAGYWLTLLMAAVFVFGATLTLQGMAASMLPRPMFLRLSALMQVALFGALVSVYVLEPSLESKAALSSAANHGLLGWLPSYWFWGMFQELNGSAHGIAELSWLARRAWMGVVIALGGAIAMVMLNYFHTMARVIEEPEIQSEEQRMAWRLGSSPQRAVISFALQTISRSRRHRMILSFYMGMGFGVMLILLRASMGKQSEMAIALLAASALMLCTAAVAMRTIFSMPMKPEANWIFRAAALEPADRYLKGVRSAFLLLGIAPVWCGFSVLLWMMLPWRAAAAHLVLLATLGVILTNLCSGGFRKIPFTCSYLPGRGNLQFAVWGALVLLPLSVLGAKYEWMWLQSAPWQLGGLTVALALVLPALGLHWWTTLRFRSANELLFEDVEESPVVSLGLTDATAQAGLAPMHFR